jgi:peptidoglycan/LPS O-acetylase OafA/YrhL
MYVAYIVEMHMNAHRRLDIQILRGFAISAVVLFHTDERLLPGGFLGVDISSSFPDL